MPGSMARESAPPLVRARAGRNTPRRCYGLEQRVRLGAASSAAATRNLSTFLQLGLLIAAFLLSQWSWLLHSTELDHYHANQPCAECLAAVGQSSPLTTLMDPAPPPRPYSRLAARLPAKSHPRSLDRPHARDPPGTSRSS